MIEGRSEKKKWKKKKERDNDTSSNFFSMSRKRIKTIIDDLTTLYVHTI